MDYSDGARSTSWLRLTRRPSPPAPESPVVGGAGSCFFFFGEKSGSSGPLLHKKPVRCIPYRDTRTASNNSDKGPLVGVVRCSFYFAGYSLLDRPRGRRVDEVTANRVARRRAGPFLR